MKRVPNIFLSDKFILLVIIINSIVMFIQSSGVYTKTLNFIDATCIVIFLIEMICKMVHYGFKQYWSNGWNVMDGILVIISLPSLMIYFTLMLGIKPLLPFNFSIFLVLRVLRVFRFFRVIHIFPNFGSIMKRLWVALKDSLPVFVGFFLLILISSLFSCALFKEAAPQYFANPLDSIYSTFRLCTVEGWYEIPDAFSQNVSPTQMGWIRVYFVLILIAGGIVGLSLVNSIFVDAMVSENNDQLEKDVKLLQTKIDELKETIDKMQLK